MLNGLMQPSEKLSQALCFKRVHYHPMDIYRTNLVDRHIDQLGGGNDYQAFFNDMAHIMGYRISCPILLQSASVTRQSADKVLFLCSV